MSNKPKFSISKTYLASKKNLSLKYNSFENSYTLVCINNLIYTENCHIVARFKDFLYYDDDTEFLNKFFQKKQQKKILIKVFNFYSKYCKVFPNYMILPENEFLYRNLRKKQKLIDQFNEIKKEEEENRKHLKLKKNKDNENNYIIFGKKEQESIDKYSPSFSQSNIIMADYLNFNNNKETSKSKILNDINNSKNSITISLNFNNNNFDINDINTSELTLISITNLIKKTPSKTEKNSGNKNSKDKLSFTPQKNKTKIEKFNINEEKITTNLNEDFKKKYISYYHNKKHINQNIFNSNIKNNISNTNNYNYSTNVSNKTNNKKKEFVTSKKNSLNSNNIYGSNNNNILISSITKTGKKKDGKNIRSAIAKKKLFSNTEKAISHKRPIYNYQNKKSEKNSISINNNISNNKQKKNINDMISITLKHSISPPDTKINSIKIKIIDNLSKIQEIKKNMNFKSPSHNVSNSNNLSYVTKINKIKKLNENEKINTNLDKKTIKNNTAIKKFTTKEKMKNYKNILKTDKTNHFSYDINKNHIIVNKNTFTNFTEKNSNNKNISNDKIRKTEKNNKYISPSNKNYTMTNINKNIKTPNKPEIKQYNNYKKAILNTKESSHNKIQNYIKKILDKNNTKKEFFINKPKIK